MKNFKSKTGYSGGGRSDRGGERGGRSFQDKSRGVDREMKMFKAQCSECKKGCDVPFKPNGEKPVYCRDCFSDKRGSEDRGIRPNYASNETKKLSYERPVSKPEVTYNELRQTPHDDGMKKQLLDISFKLDTLITAMEKLVTERKENTTQTHSSIAIVNKATKPVAVKKLEASKKTFEKKVVAKKSAVKKNVTKKTPASKKK